MIKKRLLMLADRLDRIAKKAEDKRARKFSLVEWVTKSHCGTTACAVGEACFLPAFRKLGLRYGAADPGFQPVPKYRSYRGWEAVDKFFQLNREQSYYLFYYNSYTSGAETTPAQVAERIRNFVDLGTIVYAR